MTDLNYVDNVALLDESASNLAASLNQFEEEASHLGLHISRQKTKLQNLGCSTDVENITVRGHRVESVAQFPYLDSTQSSGDRSD